MPSSGAVISFALCQPLYSHPRRTTGVVQPARSKADRIAMYRPDLIGRMPYPRSSFHSHRLDGLHARRLPGGIDSAGNRETNTHCKTDTDRSEKLAVWEIFECVRAIGRRRG